VTKLLRDDEGNEWVPVAEIGPIEARSLHVRLARDPNDVRMTCPGDIVCRPVAKPAPPVPSVAEALERVRQVMWPRAAREPGSHVVHLSRDKEDALAALIAAVRACDALSMRKEES